MKKTIWLILSFILFSGSVKAYVNYDIIDYLIDATIVENGDLQVKELIVLDGEFHGYIRDILYQNTNLNSNSNSFSNNDIYNAKGITEMKIYAKEVENEISYNTFEEIFIPLTKVYYESEAKNTNYIENSISNGKSYKMYYESTGKPIAYLLSYKIKSAVVLHQDIAELYWTFIGDGFDDKINNLQIKVHLPNEDNSDLFRYWAHGDIAGIINKTDNKTVLATMKSLAKNNPVDLRITFDKSLIRDSTYLNSTQEQALPKILETEIKRAQKREEEIRFAQKIYQIVKIVSITFLLILLAWWIYVYLKYDKEYKSTFKNQYNREFIEDYNVEVIDYLMKGSITPNAMAASIMNLIYKKNIKVEEIKDNSKTKNYRFTLVNRDGVNDTEDVLLDFLFENVGKQNTFTTKDLNNYASSSSTYMTFQSKYSNWLNCVRKDGERQEFYEKNGIPIVGGIFLLLIAVLISFLVFYYHINYLLGYLVFPISLIYMIYSLMIKKRTKKGNEHYVRWLAFKKFLKDFGNFSEKELPEIVLWEKYLVYATIFGLAKEVEKSMNTKISEYPAYYNNSYIYFPDYHIANHLTIIVNNSISSANTTALRDSKSPSGNGLGGGFSSGSGFGGGGGGGRGF